MYGDVFPPDEGPLIVDTATVITTIRITKDVQRVSTLSKGLALLENEMIEGPNG